MLVAWNIVPSGWLGVPRVRMLSRNVSTCRQPCLQWVIPP